MSSTRTGAATEVHLCGNYSHLLVATADLASRRDLRSSPAELVFIDDHLELGDRLLDHLVELTGARVRRVSDRASIEAFARLPRFLPGMLRRNVSWTDRGRPILPRSWAPASLAGTRYDIGFVYHPGFFLSKVIAGRCDRIVMRDSGYANYVRHAVPMGRALPRLLAGRSPRFQTWGEEPWVDEIEVVRPDRLPQRIRHKASRLTLDGLMAALPSHTSRAVAAAFWGSETAPSAPRAATALILTQPIDQLGFCSTAAKNALYDGIARRLEDEGFEIAVKPHPLERDIALRDRHQLPAAFPIEAWTWLGVPQFDLAVSLNSAALADREVSFARKRVQLIPPTSFYAAHWSTWPDLIGKAWDRSSTTIGAALDEVRPR